MEEGLIAVGFTNIFERQVIHESFRLILEITKLNKKGLPRDWKALFAP